MWSRPQTAVLVPAYGAGVRVVIGYFAIAAATWPAFVAMLGKTSRRDVRMVRILEALVPALAWPIILPFVAVARLMVDRSGPSRPLPLGGTAPAAPAAVVVSRAPVRL